MKNAIIILQFIALLLCSAIIYEANRAKYWYDYYLYNEIESTYVYACSNSSSKSVIDCKMDAFDYVEDLKRKNNVY